MMKELLFLITVLMIASCNQSNDNKTEDVSPLEQNEDLDIDKNRFSVQLINSETFIQNDMTYFNVLPHNMVSVSLKPKKKGTWLQFNNDMYSAYITNMDTVYIEIVGINTETGLMQDTSMYSYITNKNK